MCEHPTDRPDRSTWAEALLGIVTVAGWAALAWVIVTWTLGRVR